MTNSNKLSLIDIENDFTEEEESVFAPKRSVGTNVVGLTDALNATPTFEESIIKKYQAGMPVIRLTKQYGMSTATLYKILDTHNVRLRGARNQYTNPDTEAVKSSAPVAFPAPTPVAEESPKPEHILTIHIPKDELAKGGTFTIKLDFEGESN